MKKVIKVTAIVIAIIIELSVILFLFKGCGRFISEIDEGLENSQSAVGSRVGLEILRCFDKKDTDSLKELFCFYIENTHDLDSEIKEAFTAVDDIAAYQHFSIGGEEHVRKGKVVYSNLSSTIPVKTSSDEKFDICFVYMQECKNENRIGLERIAIYDDDNNLICTIGENI